MGQWVRKNEAAALFGVSERTIDNRVAAGKLQKRRHPYGVTEIFVDDEAASSAPGQTRGVQTDRSAQKHTAD